jgi:methanogenic corrinoid protein MtbC1
MLGSVLQPTAASLLGPRIVFATPPCEPHEIGLQMAALTALGAGANPVYLGAELPIQEMVDSVDQVGAVGLALSLVTIAPARAERAVQALRDALPDDVHLWIGGAAASTFDPHDGIEYIDRLDSFERRVALLGFERPKGR